MGRRPLDQRNQRIGGKLHLHAATLSGRYPVFDPLTMIVSPLSQRFQASSTEVLNDPLFTPQKPSSRGTKKPSGMVSILGLSHLPWL